MGDVVPFVQIMHDVVVLYIATGWLCHEFGFLFFSENDYHISSLSLAPSGTFHDA